MLDLLSCLVSAPLPTLPPDVADQGKGGLRS